MSRQIDYRSASRFPADLVHATTLERGFLEARLAELGGPRAALLEHHVDDGRGRYRLQHGLDAQDLPSIVRNLVPGDIVIVRTESWNPGGAGRFAGEATVEIPGTPASAEGSMRLADLAAGGSELVVTMSLTVKIPFLGGRIESSIGEQVKTLLAAETAFLLQWLEKRA